jgi:hypothetical protein
MVETRARRRSMILRLVPPQWLTPLLAPTVNRLRARLRVAILALSVLVVGAIFWLALQ